MTSFRATARIPRAVLVAVAAALLLAAAAVPAAAQIRQTPPPPSAIKPPPPPINRTVTAERADLVIDAISVSDNVEGDQHIPNTVAALTVRNGGAAEAVFPAGSVILRTETLPGGPAFQQMTANVEYRIPAGATVTLSTHVTDLCAPAHAAAVTFVLDPGSAVPETNESNNRRMVPAVLPFAKGDLVPMHMRMWSLQYGGNDQGPLPTTSSADLSVDVENEGDAPVLLCPGTTMMRETASPVSGTKGFREVKFSGTSIRLFSPGETLSFTIKGAFQPGDLPPGTYTWKVMINPDTRLPEKSTANNGTSTVVQFK